MSKFDYIYRRLLLTKFFTKGWGKPDNLKRLFEFRKTISNRETCQKLVSKDYPVHIDKDETFSDCRIMEGHFLSPVTQHLPGIMPKEVQVACFQVVLPKEWRSPNLRPMCLHLAGTGDHYYWRRRTLMARPLIKEAGIGSIILENPYYGMRKPKTQVRSSLHNVSDLFVMGAALILESQVLLHWCERNGWGPLGITGISMGGHMASLAATNWPKPIALVPCLSWSTASGVFTTGVLSGAIPWEVLQSQYLSDSVYQDEISKLLHSPEDAYNAYNAAQSHDAYEMGKLFAGRLDDLQKYQQECSHSSTERTSHPKQELQSDTYRKLSNSRALEGLLKKDLTRENLPRKLKHGSSPNCDEVMPEGSSQEASFIDISHKKKVRVVVEDTGEICMEREMLNKDAPAQSGQNLSFLTDSAKHSKQKDEKSQESFSKGAAGPNFQSGEQHEGQLSYFGQQLETNDTNHAQPSSLFHKELKHSENAWTTGTSSLDSESKGGTDSNSPVTPQFPTPSDFSSSKDSVSGPSIPDRKLSSRAASASVASTSADSKDAGAPKENQSEDPMSASLETATGAGASGVGGVKTTLRPLLQRLGRTMQHAIQSGSSRSPGQEPLTLQHAEAKSKLSKPKAGILRGTFGRQGSQDTKGTKSKEARMQEASNFMRGVMDECTHLGNFSLPVDTRLVIIIAAKQDAYVPRCNVLGLDKLWPGAEVRYVDRGHIAAFLLNQDVFRKAIIDAFDRQVKLYWNQDDGDHTMHDTKQKEISGKK